MSRAEARALRGVGRTVSVAAVFLLLGAWICFEALQVPVGTVRMPGAGFFPLCLGIALSVLSVMLLVTGVLSPASASERLWPERPAVFYLVGGMVAATWLFERAGFLLTMAMFLVVAVGALGRMRWMPVVVLAVVGSVTAYIVFGRVLLIALPPGILPF